MIDSDETRPTAELDLPRLSRSNLLVLAAIAVVTAALGAGLHIQFQLPLAIAALAVLPIFTTALLAHLVVLRGNHIGALEAQVAKLRGVSARASQSASRSGRSLDHARAPAEPEAPATGAHEESAPPDGATSVSAIAGRLRTRRDPIQTAAGTARSSSPTAARTAEPRSPDLAQDLAQDRGPDRPTQRHLERSLEPAAEPALPSDASEPLDGPIRPEPQTTTADAITDALGPIRKGDGQPIRASAPAPAFSTTPIADRGADALTSATPLSLPPPVPATRAEGRADDAAKIQDFVERLANDRAPAGRPSRVADEVPRTSGRTRHAPPDAAPADAPARSATSGAASAAGADKSRVAASTVNTEAVISQSVRALQETAASMRKDQQAPASAPLDPFGMDSDTGDAQWAENDDDALAATTPPPDPRIHALIAALRSDGIEVYLEPIVGLEEKTPRHFEISGRFRDDDGRPVDPYADPSGLRGTGVLPLLDLAKIGRVADLSRRLAERGKTGAMFTSLAAETFEDDDFLNRFAEIYTSRASFAEQLVVTLAQEDARIMSDAQLEMVEDMRDLGFRFALDHVTTLDMDFEALRGAGVAFIKLDAMLFLNGMPAGDDSMIPAEDICAHLRGLGFEVIVEQIADEAVLERLIVCGVTLGRGDLFGGARPVKAEIFAASASAAA